MGTTTITDRGLALLLLGAAVGFGASMALAEHPTGSDAAAPGTA